MAVMPINELNVLCNGGVNEAPKMCEVDKLKTLLTSRITMEESAVCRIAGWPVETLLPLSARELSTRAKRIAEQEGHLQIRSAQLVKEIFPVVKNVADRDARGWLLNVKRTIQKRLAPWPEPDMHKVAALEQASHGLFSQLEVERKMRVALLEERAKFKDIYCATVEFQRRTLEKIGDSPAFARALVLANPSFAARWRARMRIKEVRTKKMRQMEETVLHYLLRAVGRATPSGGWSGIAYVNSGESEVAFQAEQTSTRCWAAPDLTPFREIVDELARTPRYLISYPLRMDPAAHCDDQLWWGLNSSGQWVSVPIEPIISILIENFTDGEPRPVSELVEFLAQRFGNANIKQQFYKALKTLIEAGVLRSALEFPAAPASPWQALDAVTPLLLEPERSIWAGAVYECRCVCKEITSYYEDLTPDALSVLLEKVATVIRNLMSHLDLSLPLPSQVVRFSRTAPFRVRWSEKGRRLIREAAGTVLATHAAVGGAEAFREALLADLRNTVTPLTEAMRLQCNLSGRALEAGLAPWKQLIKENSQNGFDYLKSLSNIPTDATPGPCGSLVFILSDEPYIATFLWGRPQPDLVSCLAYEDQPRFSWPFSGTGIESLEIVGVDAINPNATNRPCTSAKQIGRHFGSIVPLSRVLLEVDEKCRPWLRLPNLQTRFVPTYSVLAGIGVSDPAGRFLLRLAMAHGWEFLSYGIPTVNEKLGSEVPKLVVGQASLLSQRRWILPEDFIEKQRRLKGLDRYYAWMAVINTLGVTEWVWIRPVNQPDAPCLLMRTDSPIIVESVMNRLSSNCGDLLLIALPGDPLNWPIRDMNGNHYLCELMISWSDLTQWEVAKA
jgi:hypothetical protein